MKENYELSYLMKEYKSPTPAKYSFEGFGVQKAPTK